MPRFPEFIAAVEPMRRQTRAMATADPVAQYFTALNKGDASALETVWPVMWWSTTRVLGQVHGHGQLRRFVNQNNSWLAERRARIETVASTGAGGRAVVELLAHPGQRRATVTELRLSARRRMTVTQSLRL